MDKVERTQPEADATREIETALMKEKDKESVEPVVSLRAATPPADEDEPIHNADAARAVAPPPRP